MLLSGRILLLPTPNYLGVFLVSLDELFNEGKTENWSFKMSLVANSSHLYLIDLKVQHCLFQNGEGHTWCKGELWRWLVRSPSKINFTFKYREHFNVSTLYLKNFYHFLFPLLIVDALISPHISSNICSIFTVSKIVLNQLLWIAVHCFVQAISSIRSSRCLVIQSKIFVHFLFYLHLMTSSIVVRLLPTEGSNSCGSCLL